jgi:hypothetical protein
MQLARPDKNLNAGLTNCVTIPSPSSPTLPHASSARGTQVPSTTRTNLRLRLKRGGVVKYSGGLRQTQTNSGGLRQTRTTKRRCQASRGGQSCPATLQLPRPSITTQLQCVLTDSDMRRDVPATNHCTFFYFPSCPSPCDYKRERRATVTRVRPFID